MYISIPLYLCHVCSSFHYVLAVKMMCPATMPLTYIRKVGKLMFIPLFQLPLQLFLLVVVVLVFSSFVSFDWCKWKCMCARATLTNICIQTAIYLILSELSLMSVCSHRYCCMHALFGDEETFSFFSFESEAGRSSNLIKWPFPQMAPTCIYTQSSA